MRKMLLSLLVCLLSFALVSAQDEQLSPYEIALRRIEEARLSGAKDLDLGNFGLSSLPPEIGVLEDLEGLHAWGNHLMTVPPEIGNLSNLVWLNLGDNQINQLPPEIGNLQNLELLELHNNQLNSLPSELSKLEKLCYLGLRENSFHQVPTFLHELEALGDTESCYSDAPVGVHLDNNPLISPPQEVIAQGSPAILEYLRNEAWWHVQRWILGGLSSVAVVAVFVLGLGWRNRQGKKKRES